METQSELWLVAMVMALSLNRHSALVTRGSAGDSRCWRGERAVKDSACSASLEIHYQDLQRWSFLRRAGSTIEYNTNHHSNYLGVFCLV